MSSAGYQNSGVILYMHGERKYIIFAILILAFIFIGIYLVSEFISNAKETTNSVVESASFQYSDTSKPRYDGKIIFQNQCAACHIIGHYATGPDLTGFTERGPWRNKKKILEYLRDPYKFLKDNRTKYVIDLYKSTPDAHPLYSISEEQLDAIIGYISQYKNRGIP